MTQTKDMPKRGLQIDRVGLLINNHLFPPESFATGYIGSQTENKLIEDLEFIAKKARCDFIDIYRTPLLKRILFGDSKRANPKKALEQITTWVTKEASKGTFITLPAAMQVNSQGELATRSPNNNISMKIRSRTMPESYAISLYNAAGNSINDFEYFEVQGGARNTQVNRKRGTHWRLTCAYDLPFLDSLTPQQREQYNKSIGLIDYTRAVALISLNDIVKKSPGAQLIGEKAQSKNISTVLLPWQFENAPEFAFETVARQYSTKKAREDAGLMPERPTDEQMDRYLIENSTAGFVSQQAKDMIEKGLARRSATTSQRYFPQESWSIIQAFEKHLHDQGREFSGYSLEFRGTKHEMLGIRFDFPKSHPKFEKNTVVILYDDNFRLPVIMYKQTGLSKFTQNKRLENRNPLDFVNISSDRRMMREATFQEWDWTTRLRANEAIYEPTQEILEKAVNIAYQATKEIQNTPQDWRSEYICLSRQRRFKV